MAKLLPRARPGLTVNNDVREIISLLNREVARQFYDIALEIYRQFVRRNPVLTGYSRANWNISIDDPERFVSEPPAKGQGVLPPPVVSLADVEGGKRLADVYIVNGVKYIAALELGSSSKAPEGMVRITLADIESRFR